MKDEMVNLGERLENSLENLRIQRDESDEKGKLWNDLTNILDSKDRVWPHFQTPWRDSESDWSSQLYKINLSSTEIRTWKKSGLIVIQFHDLCDTGAVLYQLSYQDNWELVTLWVHNIPVDSEEYLTQSTTSFYGL